jgi:hypothetical protein
VAPDRAAPFPAVVAGIVNRHAIGAQHRCSRAALVVVLAISRARRKDSKTQRKGRDNVCCSEFRCHD